MKDVTEILSKRLLKLDSSFSREWVSHFSRLMEFIQTNPTLKQIADSIIEEKRIAYGSLMQYLRSLLDDGNKSLKQLKRCIDSDSEIMITKIKSLQKMNFDPKELSNPFFELESVYYGYCRGFVELFTDLSQGTNTDLSEGTGSHSKANKPDVRWQTGWAH